MADNVAITAGSGTLITTRAVTYSGDAAQMEVNGLAIVAGSDDAKTVADVVAVAAATDTTGTGVIATGILAQFDDVTPATVTENQFAPPRMSSRRAVLTEGTGPVTATTAGTQVGASVTSVTVLASNALRRCFILYNNSTSLCYVL